MNNPFHYESKFMQILLVLADYILLNVLYVICSIPLFTMGAAQSGLYNGLRVLQDKEDDTSCLKAFFRGLRNGFKTVTAVWCAVTVLILILCYSSLSLYGLKAAGFTGASMAFVLSIIATVMALIYQTMLTLFHAYFECTAKQLLRNAFLVIMANPLQSILAALILWAPVILLLVHYPLFLQTSILLLFLYYSVMLGLTVRLFAKPFRRLTEQYAQSE